MVLTNISSTPRIEEAMKPFFEIEWSDDSIITQK
jgi:hypothetical protein